MEENETIEAGTDQSVEAAFAASFEDKPVDGQQDAQTVEVKAVAPESKEEAAPEVPSPVALTADELASLRAAATKVDEFRLELRKAHGRIGALNDQLHQAMKAKEEQGKPAVLTPMELKKTKEEFPELASIISADLQDYFASQQSSKSVDVESLMAERLARQREELVKESIAERQETLEEEHPDAREVFSSQDFAQWMGSLSESEQDHIRRTKSPFVLSKKLTAFKSWRDQKTAKEQKAAQAKAKSKELLDDAIAPKGSGRASHTTLSEREAMEKGFEYGFEN